MTPPPAIVVPERVHCAINAALKRGVPVNAMLAVASQEAGQPGQWVRNANGTYDVGVMQFNTGFLRSLAKYGIGTKAVGARGCYPYELAAWLLHHQMINESGDFWTRMADYNSHTPWINARYRAKIMVRGARWARWLAAYMPDAPIAATGVEVEQAALDVRPRRGSVKIVGGVVQAVRRTPLGQALTSPIVVPAVFVRSGTQYGR